MSKNSLMARTVFIVIGVCISVSASALSPKYVEDKFELVFAKGAIALDWQQRERFANRRNAILETGWLCTTSFIVLGYGDELGDSQVQRSLALDRSTYIRGISERLGLGDANNGIGRSENPTYLGTAQISFRSYAGPLGCDKPASSGS